jgi:hypothetical protein
LADLKAVYDSVESARVLIEAHKSARSYGEQIRRLGKSRVRLEGVHRAIRADTIDFQKAGNGLVGCIDHMIRYIEFLEEEYHEKYLSASRKQRVDEQYNNELAQRSAKSKQQPDDDEWRVEAWNFIDTQFPALKDLRDCGQQYQNKFKCPLDEATVELRNQIARQKSGKDLKEYGVEPAKVL